MPQISRTAQRDLEYAVAQTQGLTLVDAYRPEGTGQNLAIRSKKHQVWMLGGNKSGKSYTLLIKLAYRTLPEYDIDGNKTGYLRDPYIRSRIPYGGVRAWISTYSQSTQRETIQPEFDKIFGPYIKGEKQYAEKGVRFWAETPCGMINFKWQQAEKKSYEGANIHYAALDEPHDKSIYNEIVMRLSKTKGYMMVAATLVIDPEDPDALRKLRYVEWMALRATAWERDPKLFPELDVIYADAEENPHIDIDFIIDMMAGMSAAEQMTRKTGRTVNVIGRIPFDEGKLTAIETHLVQNSDSYAPEYGMLEYKNTGDDSQVIFVKTVEEFPDYPKSGFIFKIWERPVPSDLFIRPEYFIGVDVATGKAGGDYTCAYVIRGDTGYIVASLHGHLTEIELAKQLYLLGMYYCDSSGEPAMCAIEVVSVGSTCQTYMITGLQKLGIPKYGISRLYHRPANRDMQKGLILLGTEPGWYTDRASRGVLITNMRQLLLEAYSAITADRPRPSPIPDSALPYEGKWFIYNSQGKPEAPPGKYDDRLIAAAIAKICCDQYYRSPKMVDDTPELDITDDDTYYHDPETGLIYVNMDGVISRKRVAATAKETRY